MSSYKNKFAFKNQTHQEWRTDKGIEIWEGHSNIPHYSGPFKNLKILAKIHEMACDK